MVGLVSADLVVLSFARAVLGLAMLLNPDCVGGLMPEMVLAVEDVARDEDDRVLYEEDEEFDADRYACRLDFDRADSLIAVFDLGAARNCLMGSPALSARVLRFDAGSSTAEVSKVFVLLLEGLTV